MASKRPDGRGGRPMDKRSLGGSADDGTAGKRTHKHAHMGHTAHDEHMKGGEKHSKTHLSHGIDCLNREHYGEQEQ